MTGLICLALLFSSLAQAWSNSALMQRVQSAQQQYQQLQDKHDTLVKLANYYKDPYVVESEARQQLGYIRPGEYPVIFTSATTKTQPVVSDHQKRAAQQGYWQEWWNAFFWKLTGLLNIKGRLKVLIGLTTLYGGCIT